MRTLVPLLVLAPAVLAGGGPPQPRGPGSRPAFNLPADGKAALPALLSHTQLFADVRNLSPNAALVPYEVNLPFWTGGASKRRWLAVPPGKRIHFAAAGAWGFPAGTVFVKHFELSGDGPRGEKRRLETRVLVRDAAGGVYGASYRWREDHSDAELVKEGRVEPVVLKSAGGARTQDWFFPGPKDCQTCHNAAAGLVLGVHTRQLNQEIPSPGGCVNQLLAWSRAGRFETKLAAGDVRHLPRLASPADTGRSLEDRARSYLDVNCAYCHRPGGAAADFDARYETPLAK